MSGSPGPVDQGSHGDGGRVSRALEGIFRGDEGGPFGEFAGLISTVAWVECGRITVTGGDQPSASIDVHPRA